MARPELAEAVLPIGIVILTVLFAVQRFGTHRVGRAFGPIMVDLVRGVGGAGRAAHRGAPGGAGGFVADVCGVVRRRSPVHGVHRDGRGRVGDHRCRGAVCGHGPLRASPDPSVLVRGGLPRVDPQLPGPGRPDRGAPGRDQQPVLPAGAGVGAASPGGAGHRRDDHRLAGGDLRGVLGVTAGGAVGLSAAADRAAHLHPGERADLRARGELAAVRGCAGADGGVPVLGRAGDRVRAGGDRHVPAHHHPVPAVCGDRVALGGCGS